ncbi:Opsin-5 [Varanus komodoensis]|nr:Opsin-5 [Varanus komodoensis]
MNVLTEEAEQVRTFSSSSSSSCSQTYYTKHCVAGMDSKQNFSSQDDHEPQYQQDEDPFTSKLPKEADIVAGIYLLLIGVMSTLGNGYVIYMSTQRKKKLRPAEIMTVNLAVCDLGISGGDVDLHRIFIRLDPIRSRLGVVRVWETWFRSHQSISDTNLACKICSHVQSRDLSGH